MAEWIIIPPFVNNQIVRAETFQDIWANLYTLRRPESAAQEMPGPQSSGDRWATTTTGAFLDIDADYWQLTFNSYGGNVFITADIVTFHSFATGISYWRFTLDGVSLGNTLGLAGHRDTSNLNETVNLHYLAENLASGSHTLTGQFYNVTAGTLNVEKYACTSLWTYEFP